MISSMLQRRKLNWSRVYRASSYLKSALWTVPLIAIAIVFSAAPVLRMLIPDDAAGCAGGGVGEAAGVIAGGVVVAGLVAAGAAAAGTAAIVVGAGWAGDSASVA